MIYIYQGKVTSLFACHFLLFWGGCSYCLSAFSLVITAKWYC